MKQVYFTLAIGLSLFLTGCAKKVVDTSISIYGTVVEIGTQQPLNNVLMTLIPSSRNSYTGNDGYYEFLDLEAQQYTLTAQKEGYKTDRKTVTLHAGERQQVTFTLTKE